MNKKVISIIAIVAIIAILGVVLVACNADSYQKKLEKAGYTVTAVEADEDDDYDIEWSVNGVKSNSLISYEAVSVTKFADKADAEDYEEAMIKVVGEDCVYRTGKIVIVGSSKDAVKDAK